MIRLLRIDDRLIHGQVAYGWTAALGADVILIVNDDAATNDFKRMAFDIGKPPNCKLYYRTLADAPAALEILHKNMKYKCLILVESVKDAYELVKRSPYIKHINLGGTRLKEGRRAIMGLIAVSDEDITMLRDIEQRGIKLEVRRQPSETARKLSELIK